MLRLVSRCLPWYSIVARFHNDLVQSSIAAMRIIVLLATIIGLDDYIVGSFGDIAGGSDL